MSDSYLNNLIKVTDAFQAEYVKTPLSAKPEEGCVLPTLTDTPSPLTSPGLPSNTKDCSALFTPFPIISAPFSTPENCPNGITFNEKDVNIYAALGADSPAASVTVGVSRNETDFCSYDLNIPDIVIPCFPNGPQINGLATITVVDPNKNTTTSSSLSINQSEDIACNWTFDGNVDIVLPKIPCPQGIKFKSTNLEIKTSPDSLVVDRSLVSIVKDADNSCVFDISMPQLTIPCYPNGPSVTGGVSLVITDSVAGVSTTKNIEFKEASSTPCSFDLTGPPVIIDIPCKENGVAVNIEPWAITDSFSKQVTELSGAVISKSDFCTTDITLPPVNIPCYPDGIRFTDPIKFNAYSWTSNTGGSAGGSVPIGSGAKLEIAAVTNGAITAVNIISPGSGYTTLPVIKVKGGNNDAVITTVAGVGYGIEVVNIIDGGTGYVLEETEIYVDPVMTVSNGLLKKQQIDLTNNGGRRNTDSPCTWDTDITIDLPTPKCDGGFVVSADNFNVRVGSSLLPKITTNTANYLSYNSVRLVKSTTPPNPTENDKVVCHLDLEGEIKLNFPDFISKCSKFVAGTNGATLSIAGQRIDNVVKPAPAWSSEVNITELPSGCGFDLSGNIQIPAMSCDNYQSPQSQVLFASGSGTSTLSLQPIDTANPHCGLKLVGQVFTGSGEAGGAPVNWDSASSYTEGTLVYSMFPEGGLGTFKTLTPITGNELAPSVPGVDTKYSIVSVDETGPKYQPFKLLKAPNEEFAEAPGFYAPPSYRGSTVKVAPSSAVYTSENHTDRIQVFGLDCPFVLNPGEIVYLETVYYLDNSSGQNAMVPLYSAVAVSSGEYDTILTHGSTIFPVTDIPYKLFSKQLFKNAGYTDFTNVPTSDLATYITENTNRYVGVTEQLRDDLVKIQLAALKTIANNTLADTVLFLFKSYNTIAIADDLNEEDKFGKPSVLNLSFYSTDNKLKKFGVTQLLGNHLALKNVSLKVGSANLSVSTAVPTYHITKFSPDFNGNQPLLTAQDDGTVSLSGVYPLKFQFNKPSVGDLPSTLLTNLYNNFASSIPGLTVITPANFIPVIGTGPLDIHVYFTTNNSIPSVNTGASNGKSKKYAPDFDGYMHIADANLSTDQLKGFYWIASHPEFNVNSPRGVKANRGNNAITFTNI
jgi:hypothetical protein